jgi:hypothetical protein
MSRMPCFALESGEVCWVGGGCDEWWVVDWGFLERTLFLYDG